MLNVEQEKLRRISALKKARGLFTRSPGKQGAAEAVDLDLDELADVVELVLFLDPAPLRPVHVRHWHEVQVAQLQDGGDYLQVEVTYHKKWTISRVIIRSWKDLP